MKPDSSKFSALERLKREFEEVKAHLAALTAVIGGITTAGAVNFERLEECVNFAVTGLRPGARRVVLAKASGVLEDLEAMQQEERAKWRPLCRTPTLGIASSTRWPAVA